MIDVEKIKPQIKELAEKHGLKLVMLFGSQVTGKTHKESDYDIAYLSDKKLSFDDEGRIIIEIAPIIGARDERLINLSSIKGSLEPFCLKKFLISIRFFLRRPQCL